MFTLLQCKTRIGDEKVLLLDMQECSNIIGLGVQSPALRGTKKN